MIKLHNIAVELGDEIDLSFEVDELWEGIKSENDDIRELLDLIILDGYAPMFLERLILKNNLNRDLSDLSQYDLNTFKELLGRV